MAPRIIGGTAVGVAVILATVGTLWATGTIDLPFFKKTEARAPAPPSYDGMVLVPVSAKTIPAYTRVTRDYLIDLKTARLKFVPLAPAQVSSTMLVDLSKIVGRVTSHDKPAGYAFTESDFLPKGSREGLVGGIPPGKRALDIEVDKIKGIQALRAGDHFDLVSSLALDSKNKMGRSPLLVPVGLPPQTLKKVAVDLLVQDGIVVSPVTTRKIDTGPPSPRTGIAPSKVVHEVVIAVGPDEMDGVMESLALKADLTCFARSGRPEDPSATAGKDLVPVPVSAQPVAAYSELTRDSFINPRSKKPLVVYLRREEIPASAVTGLDKLLGRVTRREKPAGHVFTKDDLLPEGTRPGLVGGIPAGKRAVEIDAAKIKGIHSLKAGDRFDLIASVAIDPNKAQQSRNVILAPSGAPDRQKRIAVDVVVHRGVIVLPVTTKLIQTGSPFSGAADSSTKTIQEVVIAIDPREAALLSVALALKADITCIARSGRPDDPGEESVTPGIKPPKVRVIEVISGSKRQVYEIPEPPAAGDAEAAPAVKTAAKDRP
jgi:Flp pilus assembly protein CpaB